MFKAIAKAAFLPPTGLLFIILLGLFLISRFPRTGKTISIIATVCLLALSVPLTSHKLINFLGTFPPLNLKEIQHTQAIVILGGGVRRNASEYGKDTLGQLTLERVRYGAWIAKATRLPVLVTGGSILGSETEAKLMQEALKNEFGIKVRWSEEQSQNTRENAEFSATILAQEKIRHVILVTHNFHMPRAKAEFVTSGISVMAAPTGILNDTPEWPSDYFPRVSGLQESYYICNELLAKLVLKIFSSS